MIRKIEKCIWFGPARLVLISKKADFQTMHRYSHSVLKITGLIGFSAFALSLFSVAPAPVSVTQFLIASTFLAIGFQQISIGSMFAISTFAFSLVEIFSTYSSTAHLTPIRATSVMSLALSLLFLSLMKNRFSKPAIARALWQQLSGMMALTAAFLSGISLISLRIDEVTISNLLVIAFAVGGSLVLSGLSLLEIGSCNTEAYRRVSILAFVSAMVVAVGFWKISLSQEKVRYKSLISDHLESAANKSQEILREATNALNRYSQRIAYLGFKEKHFLEIDSETYLSQLPILRRIAVANPKYEVVWSYPALTAKDKRGLSQASIETRREAYERAIQTKNTVLSSSLRLRSGDLGFILPTPIFKNERLTGFVYGAIDAERLFSRISQSPEFSVKVFESGQQIFNQAKGSRSNDDYTQTTSLNSGLSHWEISLTPTEKFFETNHSAIPNEVLFGGILLAFAMAGAAHVIAREQNLNRVYTEWRNAILNGADYSIISTDASGIIQTFNKAAERILLYEASELIGIASPERLHDKDEADQISIELQLSQGTNGTSGFGAFIAKAKSLGFAKEFECSYIRKDGTCCPVRLSIKPLLLTENQLDGYVCIATDVTEKKRIEAKLQTTVSRLQRVIEATGTGIWERDAQTREIQFVDARGKEILGFAPDEEIIYERAVTNIHPDDFKSLAESMDSHVRCKTEGFEAEFRIYNRLRGEERWVKAFGRISTVEGRPKNIVTTLNDVTLAVRNRKKLELALAEAESATTAKSAFLANMSHEIRTPLNGVIGMASLLMDSGLASTQLSYASVIHQSGNALLRLINDILDFSKIEAGKMELEASSFDLTTVVETQVDMLIAKAQQKNISLSTFISNDLGGDYIGDAGRISQVLLNLVSNSVKFTQTGGVMISAFPLSSAGDRQMQWVRFEVRDTGIGVPPELAQKLFQPFVQADSSISKKFGGTGLGLSISSRLVDLMNGKIGVQGVANVGSTFWFEIPLQTRKQKDVVIDGSSVAGSGEFSGKTALLIDGDVSVREVLRLYLNELGIQCIEAPNELIPFEAPTQSLDYVFLGLEMSESSREDIKSVVARNMIATSMKKSTLQNPISTTELIAQSTTLISVVPFGRMLQSDQMHLVGVDRVLAKPVKKASLMAALRPESDSSQLLSIGSRLINANLNGDASEDALKLARASCRILVADDNSINQIVARSILTKLGYTAAFVGNGLEVLEMLKNASFDLILMDCQMPEMDGFEATRRIRLSDVDEIRTITIIALTANASESDSKQCIAAGMDDFLAKPIVTDTLGKMLLRWTSRRSFVRERKAS